MRRRYRERRYRRNRRDDYNRRRISLTSMFRTPRSQLAVLAVAVLVIVLLVLNNRSASSTPTSLPPEITVSEAFTRYQNGALLLDVRTQGEWDEVHAPNSMLIPLEQLASRMNELPRDREILVVCHSGGCSQQGRDILLNAGFEQVSSVQGGLNEWRASGYPVEPQIR